MTAVKCVFVVIAAAIGMLFFIILLWFDLTCILIGVFGQLMQQVETRKQDADGNWECAIFSVHNCMQIAM